MREFLKLVIFHPILFFTYIRTGYILGSFRPSQIRKRIRRYIPPQKLQGSVGIVKLMRIVRSLTKGGGIYEREEDRSREDGG